jgi:anaerobic nitric oxide reductase flavorubredoxin
MALVEIKPGIFWIGVDDRTTDLFEGIWPITDVGIVNNSYFINDEKKMVIDSAKAFQIDTFLENVGKAASPSEIDYVVINHMEPDHSGAFEALFKAAPKAVFLGTRRITDLLREFYGITDRVRVVTTGETVSLGRRTVEFVETPMIHWPETMMTYETGDRILFSGDGFGGYGSLGDKIFDDTCADIDFYLTESLRYYTNVVAKFSTMVKRGIEKLATYDVGIVAPAHGLIWRSEPGRIIDLYRKWAECADGKTERAVTVIHSTMYGNTARMLAEVTEALAETGIPFESFDVSRTHISYILPSLWTKSAVIVAAPTYEASLFPPMVYALDMAEIKGIKNKKVFRFGSYGWSGGAQKKFEAAAERMGWEVFGSYEFIGRATPKDIEKCRSSVTQFVESL